MQRYGPAGPIRPRAPDSGAHWVPRLPRSGSRKLGVGASIHTPLEIAWALRDRRIGSPRFAELDLRDGRLAGREASGVPERARRPGLGPPRDEVAHEMLPAREPRF